MLVVLESFVLSVIKRTLQRGAFNPVDIKLDRGNRETDLKLARGNRETQCFEYCAKMSVLLSDKSLYKVSKTAQVLNIVHIEVKNSQFQMVSGFFQKMYWL